MSSHENRGAGADRRSWTGPTAHIGAVALLILLLVPLWTAMAEVTPIVLVTLPVVMLYATVWAIVVLSRAFRRTSPLYADRHRRQWVRVAQWVAGIVCAADAVFTIFVLWVAYVWAYGDPWSGSQF